MDRKRPAVDAPVPAAPNKDQFTCEKERERFLKDLRQFHEGRGTTVPRWPYIGGKPVDLHALYKAVTQLGGWEKVSNDDTWTEIQEQFGIPLSCSNADYALRQIYVRYLNAFEKLHHFSQDPDSREDSTDLDDLHTSRKKATGLVSGVAVTYNYQQHILPESTREMLGLPKEFSRPSEYLRIERSLLSGLPNELDFAVNVCLLLSTEGRHTLKGPKALRIVELLLSHVGISKEADLALIWLIPDSKLNFLKFWNESIEDHEVKELLCPECLLVSRVEEYQAENAGDAVDSDLLKILNLGRGLGTEDREVQRVIQLAVIVRNLSFEEENLDCFASSLVVFRFLMLCIYNSNGCIHQLALDAMANIAFKIDVLFLRKMSLDPVDCGLSQLVLRTISTFLTSHDKFEVVSALEMLSRLCQVESNEDAICSQLGDAIYEHLIQLLTIQDLQLIVSALETTYQLSEIGAATSSRIANVRSSVDVLIALLTVEAQSYGPCTLPGIEAVEDTVDIQTTVHNQTMGPPPARLALPIAPRPTLPLPCSATQVSVSAGIQPPQTPRPRVLMAPVSSSLVPQAVISAPRQAPVSAVADNEAAACNWLLTQYELSADSSLKKMEMYRKYASVFGVYGLQNLVSPTCFASCIRVAFPSVEQELVDKDGANEAVYKGLVARQKPGPFSPATGDLPPGHQVIPSISSGAALGLIKVGQTMTQLVPSAGAVSSTAVTFPAIQHILQNNQGRMDSLVAVRSDCLVSASAAKSAVAAASETNLVKTLLASKVAQHLNRLPIQQPDGHDANMRLASVDVKQGLSRESNMTDRPPSNPRPFTHIRLTLNQNSHCGMNRVGTTEGGSQGVLSEHSYIQTAETFASTPVNGNFVVVAASQSDGSASRCDLFTDKSTESLTGYYTDQGQGSDGISSCFSLNCYKQNAVGTAETASATRPDCSTLFGNHQSTDVPVVMNGTFSSVEISGKSRDSLHCAVEQLNGTDSLPLPNGIVKDLVNGNCLSENSDPESAKLPDDEMKTRLSSDKNDPEMQCCASARDTVSPFPHIANVDGLFDDVSDKNPHGDDNKTAGVDSKHHCHNPDQSVAAVEKNGSQMLPQFEMDCNFPESAADNSEILLLEDFTVAREEVLMSDILTQTVNSSTEVPNISNPTGSYISESESNQLLVNIEETCEIPSGVQNSQAIDSVKNSSLSFTSTSQPLPIVIPANIQAKLASYQDGSALLSMMNQSQVPFSAMHSVVSQSSSSTTFQRPLINHNYVASFAQTVPASDAPQQQHVLPEMISNLQGNCEISKDLQSVVPFSGETNPRVDGSHIVYQTPLEDQTQSTGMAVEIPNMAAVQPGLNNPRQMVLTNPHGVQSTAVPGIQQQNSSSIFALSSAVSSTSQGSRLQFMTTSNSMRFPQLHRFVTTTTPGRIIIQRAQIVPQGQQPQLQGQQSLRPLQQPFFQRFIVSQAGGLPQRQILIQSSPVLMHQGAQGTGQARPVFVPRDQSSTGQPVVIPPSGQMLSQPQQRPVSQPSQLAAYRLTPMVSHSGHIIQHQVIGQPGQQGILSRPLVVPQTQQAGTQQGQMVTQPGQQNTKPADQQSQGHGQVIVSNQAVNIQQSQMITHQGQSGHIFTQPGQILVGQQGQILCHPGQPGQSQNTGPVVIQHGGGQFVLHSGSHNLPGCLMSIPVSSFQHGVGIKRLSETPKDQTAGPSLTPSLCLSTSTVASHVITATVPLNSGLSVATSVQQSPASGQVSPSSVSSGSSAKKRKPCASTSQPRLAKKRKKDGEDQGDGDVSQGRTQVQYLCEWNGCQRYFGSFNSIYQHATKDHFEAIKESSITCEWAGCDTLRRQRWSFMTHLQDRHLNEASLKAAATRRQQQASGTTSPSPQASTTVPATAVYPPNAALQAIRRFSARPPFIELTDAKEGPISKHIHLTSALILRNLARYSSVGRSLIKKHEKHLALIAFSETESSSAISNCLWELHRH